MTRCAGWSSVVRRSRAGDDGALFRFLCASSDSVVGRRRVASTWSSSCARCRHRRVVGGQLDRRRSRASRPRALHDARPGLVVVALSPFGLDGPWDDRPTTDFTRQALCGGHVQRGTPDAAAAAVRRAHRGSGPPAPTARSARSPRCDGSPRHGRRRPGRRRRPRRADVQPAAVPGHLVPDRGRAVPAACARRSCRACTRPPTAGSSLQTTTGQQWLDFCVMVGRDDWLRRRADGARHVPHAAPRRDRAGDRRVDLGARRPRRSSSWPPLLRIPVAEVGNGANLPHFDHLVDGGWFADEPARVHAAVGAVPPRRWRDAATVRRRADASGATPSVTARGRRPPRRRTTSTRRRRPRRRRCRSPASACSTSPRSGPGRSSGHACAILGAEVIHVESTKQPDGIRCNTTRPMSEPQWWEWCPMFQGSNTNKLDLAVELDTDRGRELFLDLVAVSDVVIDNFSPRVLEQLGLDQDVLLARNPQRDRAARAGVRRRRSLAGAARLRADHRGAVGDRLDHRVPRPRARTAVGHRRRARRRARDRSRCCSRSSTGDRTGRGMFLECPMVGASLNLAAEQVVEYSAYGRLLERRGNRSPRPCVPQGVYRTADVDPDGTQDRWVAISVADDDQWRAVSRDACSAGCDPRSPPSAARREDELDARIADWCATRATRRRSCDRCRARASRASRWCRPTSTTGCRTVVCAWPVRTGRAPGHRHRRLHRCAVPSRQRPARAPPHVARRCSASTTATCSPASSG